MDADAFTVTRRLVMAKHTPTQRRRPIFDRRKLWAYYTRLMLFYAKTGNRTMWFSVKHWRSALGYQPVAGDLALVHKATHG